jgi:5-methylcytosine-specific restriction endonuclease McrA
MTPLPPQRLFIPATCHPNRYDAGEGLCHTCRRGRFNPATCHPNRRVRAKGLCGSCYIRSRPRGGPIARSVVLAKLAAQGGKCAYCHQELPPEKATADHIVAVVRGGSDDESNIAAACQPCNSRKWANDAPKDSLIVPRVKGVVA